MFPSHVERLTFTGVPAPIPTLSTSLMSMRTSSWDTGVYWSSWNGESAPPCVEFILLQEGSWGGGGAKCILSNYWGGGGGGGNFVLKGRKAIPRGNKLLYSSEVF